MWMTDEVAGAGIGRGVLPRQPPLEQSTRIARCPCAYQPWAAGRYCGSVWSRRTCLCVVGRRDDPCGELQGAAEPDVWSVIPVVMFAADRVMPRRYSPSWRAAGAASV